MDPIFQSLTGELLFTPDPPRGVEDTQRLPAVQPAPQREFRQDDGSTYTRMPAAVFEDGDQIDSTTITDPGAPA